MPLPQRNEIYYRRNLWNSFATYMLIFYLLAKSMNVTVIGHTTMRAQDPPHP